MKKILIVDNDKDVLSMVKFLLKRNEYVVRTTSKWQIISDTIKKFIPDLILLDIDLEGADGGDICKELKQSQTTQHVPVVLFSVHSMPELYLKRCEAQGYVPKPFELNTLLNIIKQNLN